MRSDMYTKYGALRISLACIVFPHGQIRLELQPLLLRESSSVHKRERDREGERERGGRVVSSKRLVEREREGRWAWLSECLQSQRSVALEVHSGPARTGRPAHTRHTVSPLCFVPGSTLSVSFQNTPCPSHTG